MDAFEALLSKFEDPVKKEVRKAEEKPLVLVVDDDESMRRGLMRTLSAKFSILVASNGPDGLKAFNENDVCSVILDVKMPGMDGFEVCMHLRQTDKPDVPVLFLTAYQSEHDVQRIDDRFHPFAFLDKGGDYDLVAYVYEAVQTYKSLRNEKLQKTFQ